MRRIFVFALLFSNFLFADEKSLDELLQNQIKQMRMRPIEKKIPTGDEKIQIELGRKLFTDADISGNRRVACISCHNITNGTSDSTPFSLDENGDGLLRRNAQSLFNLKNYGDRFYFWDGRVEFDQKNHRYMTPEKELNGLNPKRLDIVKALNDGLAAQVIFPMVSREEMRGKIGDNEIANEETNIGAWDRIVDRIKDKTDDYEKLFTDSFKSTPFKEINIGHIGSAISKFIQYEFYSYDYPYNRYIAGDVTALSEKEKKGLYVFMNKARCILCHQGANLTNNNLFFDIGVPELGVKKHERDLGRYEITKQPLDKFAFKVPSLVNIALSAPYFHNGSKLNLKEVVKHYNQIRISNTSYQIPLLYQKTAIEPLIIRNQENQIGELLGNLPFAFLANGLNLTDEDIDDLVYFLEVSLTDYKYQNNKIKKSFKKEI